MASIGINFRGSSTFVTDGAGETYEINESYPVTRGGWTFGWVTAGGGSANVSSSIDRRLAGYNYALNSAGSARTFQVDLPAAGSYNIRLALGANSVGRPQYFVLKDGSTSLITIPGTATSAGSFLDATGTQYTAANWPGSNSAVAVTFSGTTLTAILGGTTDTGSSTLAHLFVEQAAAAGGPFPWFAGPGRRGLTGGMIDLGI